jgi:uncharacterized protein (TIGR02996 family)
MSDGSALRAAICAHPDDDTARLVYADWLDEHGDSKRAAFIRLRIEEARARRDDAPAAAFIESGCTRTRGGLELLNWAAVDADLGARLKAQKRYARARQNLSATAEGAPKVRGLRYAWSDRGFISQLIVDDAEAFLARADDVFRAVPATEVRFFALNAEQALQFAGTGHLARVRGLTLSAPDPHALAVFGGHADAAGVRALTLEDGIAGEHLAELAGGSHWTGLESLDVADPFNEDDDWDDEDDEYATAEPGALGEALRAGTFTKLRKLSAWSAGLTDADAAIIAKRFPELRDIDISLNQIGNAGAFALARSKSLKHLRNLDLSSCDLTDGAAAGELIVSPKLEALTVLRLDRNGFGAPDPGALAGRCRAPGLRVLLLNNNVMTAESTEALARCPAVRGLWYLSFAACQLTNAAVERFARFAQFDALAALDLAHNGFGPPGVKALAASPLLARAQWLDIMGNDPGETGAKALIKSPHLGKLKFLNANGRGLAALRSHFKKAMQ